MRSLIPQDQIALGGFTNTNGINPASVDDSDFIDSVFYIESVDVEINSDKPSAPVKLCSVKKKLTRRFSNSN